MKYILYISIIVALSSCSSESLVVKPEYTTTESIYALNVGMSESQVIKKLGISPYDIKYNLSDNTKVLIWKYKRPYHEINRKSKGNKSSLSSGSERFKGDLELFATFSNGELIRYYTSSGEKESKGHFNKQHDLETITK